MRTSLLLATTLVLGFAAGQVLSQDAAKRSKEEVIKAHERYATPGTEHARLKALEGNFEAHVKVLAQPGEPMKESVGKVEDKLVFDGLFLREDVEGTCPITGKNFQGVGYTGFDNLKKKYVSTWLSSLGSGIETSEGIADASGKVITFTGTCTDPVTGKEQKTRSVLTIQDENKHTFVLFGQGPDGKELQFMTIEYNRTIGK